MMVVAATLGYLAMYVLGSFVLAWIVAWSVAVLTRKQEGLGASVLVVYSGLGTLILCGVIGLVYLLFVFAQTLS